MRVAPALLILLFFISTRPTTACLRPTVDQQAVGWSTDIVEATLITAGKRQRLASYPGGAKLNAALWSYQLYKFKLTRVLDGKLKAGEDVEVVRLFVAYSPSRSHTKCDEKLSNANRGKSFLLLLRSRAGLLPGMPISEAPTSTLITLNACYSPVYVAEKSTLQPETTSELPELIKLVRGREAVSTEQELSTAAHVIATSTDKDQVEHATQVLSKSGMRGVQALQGEIETSSDHDVKVRLLNWLVQLAPAVPKSENRSHR